MKSTKVPDFLPKDFFDCFLDPILKIDVLDSEANNKFRELLQQITESKLDDYFKVLLRHLDFLISQENKKQLLEFLYESCPPKNHYYITFFKHLLAELCQQFILSNPTHEKLVILNDISIEYWANLYDFYSIKLYQREGSLSQLMDNAKYILETLVGFGEGYRASRRGLGAEHHKIIEMNAFFNEEVIMPIYFNQNNINIFNHNNIYIFFWSRGGKLKLWDDISLSTINKITEFLQEFLLFSNLEIININQSCYFKKSDLPEVIIETIEEISKRKTPLKFKRIIEMDIKFEEQIYQDLLIEINGAYRHYYFASMYILIRKLLENLLIDCLRNYYKEQNISKYFSTGKSRFHGFEKLKENFNAMKEEESFIRKVGTVDQNLVDLLDGFKDLGNIHAHSLFNLSHQSIIEHNKSEINLLLKRLSEIRKDLIN